MGVSENSGTPKWMVYDGKTYWNGWFGGYHYFWKHPYHATCTFNIFHLSSSKVVDLNILGEKTIYESITECMNNKRNLRNLRLSCWHTAMQMPFWAWTVCERPTVCGDCKGIRPPKSMVVSGSPKKGGQVAFLPPQLAGKIPLIYFANWVIIMLPIPPTY